MRGSINQMKTSKLHPGWYGGPCPGCGEEFMAAKRTPRCDDCWPAFEREQAIRKAWQPTHKHLKSGGLYRVIGHGFIEATVEPATIYEATNGVVWIRPSKEFNDGRFEPV
jgi:hypothetical protein